MNKADGKTINNPGPEKSPGFLLWQVSTNWRRLVETALIEIGLTYSQFILLASLERLNSHQSAVAQVELARHCRTDITMTSQILRTLERKGYIERKMQKGNERSKFPKVTKRGAQLIEQALPIVEKVDQQFFGVDTKEYLKLLKQLG
jgi:DNA-binding MarR family transcriptional regulator